jgi:hypothetical protein
MLSVITLWVARQNKLNWIELYQHRSSNCFSFTIFLQNDGWLNGGVGLISLSFPVHGFLPNQEIHSWVSLIYEKFPCTHLNLLRHCSFPSRQRGNRNYEIGIARKQHFSHGSGRILSGRILPTTDNIIPENIGRTSCHHKTGDFLNTCNNKSHIHVRQALKTIRRMRKNHIEAYQLQS